MTERDGVAEVLRDMQEYRDLRERIRAMFGDAVTLNDVVDSLERKVREPEKLDPVNARILTYEESDMWDAYRAIGTPEQCKEAVECTRWIPVSERMPEKYGKYLCCNEYGAYIIGYPEESELAPGRYIVDTNDCIMYDCIAWMPLPEPYHIAGPGKKVGDSE